MIRVFMRFCVDESVDDGRKDGDEVSSRERGSVLRGRIDETQAKFHQTVSVLVHLKSAYKNILDWSPL